MSARVKWTAAIVGLLLANVVATIILITSARSDGGPRIVPEYRAPAR